MGTFWFWPSPDLHLNHILPAGMAGGLGKPPLAPEQALAVIELLDDLRNRIWVHCELSSADHASRSAPHAP